MYNSIKEMQEELTNERLIDLFHDSLGKTEAEIKDFLLQQGVEISDVCAKECHKLCEGIEALSDDASEDLAAGEAQSNGGAPGKAAWYVKKAIDALLKEKSTSSELKQAFIQDSIDELNNILNKSYIKEDFVSGLTRVRIGLAFIPDARSGVAIAAHFIQLAQQYIHNL